MHSLYLSQRFFFHLILNLPSINKFLLMYHLSIKYKNYILLNLCHNYPKHPSSANQILKEFLLYENELRQLITQFFV